MHPDTRRKAALEAFKYYHENGMDLPVDNYDKYLVPLPVATVPAVKSVRISDVSERPTRWLWPGHIPFGSLTLIIGDPGLGKSQVTVDLAARVTQGTPWPDMTVPEVGNVLMLASEDSIERTIAPRLKQAGADVTRCVVVQEITGPNGRSRTFSLKDDLDSLETMIADNYADVVIIDPLNGYLGSANSWKESEVRGVLAPVCAIAERHDAALIGVIHLNKDNTRAAIHRVLGSVAFAAVSRAIFAVVPHPQFPLMRYFVSVKQNYATLPPTLGFTLADGVGVLWDGREYKDVTADNLLAITGAPEDKAERRNAREFLTKLLANGPVKTAEVRKAADAALIADRVLFRAKYDLKVVSQHVGSPTGKGVGGYWEWRLP